jgi:tetratricopeptide (TPR) repeat protein
MAQFNVGVVLCANLERYDESLKEFDRLIQSDVNDKDSTGEIMSPFRNYRYHAWYHVSVIQDKQGRLGQAIEACFQMRRAYQSDCGTCSRNMEQSFQRDLAKLCGKVLPESQGSITNDDLTAALKKAGTGDEFLLEVGRASMKAGRTGEARAVLMLLTRDLPRSPGVVEARKLLEDLK